MLHCFRLSTALILALTCSCVRATSSHQVGGGLDQGVDAYASQDVGVSDLGDAGVGPIDLDDLGHWEVAVAADLDDGELDATGTYGTAGYSPKGEFHCHTFMGGYDPSSHPGVGLTVSFFRFAVPESLLADTTITDARLRLFGRDTWEWNAEAHTLSILGELASDAKRITSIADLPESATGRVITSASVKWGVGGGAKLDWVVGGWNRSPDLSMVIQEIVDKAGGLAMGAHIQVFIYRQGPSDDGEVAAEDYCHAASNEARLSVSFRR